MKRSVVSVGIAAAAIFSAWIHVSARQATNTPISYGPHLKLNQIYDVSFCGAREYYIPRLGSVSSFYVKPTRVLSDGWIDAEYAQGYNEARTALRDAELGQFNMTQMCFVRELQPQ